MEVYTDRDGNIKEVKTFTSFIDGKVMRDFTGADFSNKNLSEYDFSYCMLWKADFRNTNLTNTNFYNSNVENARFEGAIGLNLSNAYCCCTIMPDGEAKWTD